jgi:hypothetical protein
MSFDVKCPAAHAFRVWTERTTMWWPSSHTASGQSGQEVVIEGHTGGRIFERGPAGDEIDWGEITVWSPPERLAYLWHIRTDRADATDVDIRFVDRGDGTTRVDIEHRGWERLGERGPVWRERNTAGWGGVMPHFIAAAEAS